MLLSKNFVSVSSEDTGIFGFSPDDIIDADPGSGVLVAHDLLEHVHKGSTSFAEELAALGALYHLRIEGDIRIQPFRFSTTTRLIINEIGGLIIDALDDDTIELPSAPAVGLDYADYRAEFLHLAEDGISHSWLGLDHHDDVDWIKDRFENTDLKTKIADWILFGFVRAISLYEEVGLYETCAIFKKIASIVDGLVKASHETEGFRLKIDFDTSTGQVTINHNIDAEEPLPFNPPIMHLITFGVDAALRPSSNFPG